MLLLSIRHFSNTWGEKNIRFICRPIRFIGLRIVDVTLKTSFNFRAAFVNLTS
jgi:hypothetical protein